MIFGTSNFLRIEHTKKSLNRLTFDCWTFSGTQCWKVGQMPLSVTLLPYCWIRLSRAYRPRPTFAAFCVVVSANNYSTNAAGFPVRNSRRRRRRRRKTNFRWRGAVVRRCCPHRRVCRSRGSYRSPPRVGWPPALHVRHQGNCGCDWNCRVARRPSIDAKATTQLNSTQQRTTDAGVWHLQVRIVIIYYHKRNNITLWLLLTGFRYPSGRLWNQT